mmetsp:Transcript_17184/g.50772  ORF Transcript_17184/g.50772 Transcript_17184/m.50772 type:complete len:225 (+) Transcript_17184:104-778(+)
MQPAPLQPATPTIRVFTPHVFTTGVAEAGCRNGCGVHLSRPCVHCGGTSKTAASPMPVPMHMDTTPRPPPRRLSSWHSVAICRDPVQPSGCPRAMAPPFGFTLSIGMLSLSTQYVAWLANASLISKISTSSTERPAFSRAFGMATAGPMPMTAGGTPATAEDLRVASTGRPNRCAVDRFAISTAAAPSLTWDELPAVVVPPRLKAGFSLARVATSVPGRIPSSS